MIKIVHTITQLQSMYYVINIPLTLLAFSALTRRLVSLLHGGSTFRTPAAAAAAAAANAAVKSKAESAIFSKTHYCKELF